MRNNGGKEIWIFFWVVVTFSIVMFFISQYTFFFSDHIGDKVWHVAISALIVSLVVLGLIGAKRIKNKLGRNYVFAGFIILLLGELFEFSLNLAGIDLTIHLVNRSLWIMTGLIAILYGFREGLEK